MDCPRCGEACERYDVDVGVGVIYGPWGCACGWSQAPEYDRSAGSSEAERANPGFYVDSMGGMQRVTAIAEKCERFGIDRTAVMAAFGHESIPADLDEVIKAL